MKKLWRFWAKSLGEKSGETNEEADKIALIRTLIFLSYLTTNIFIIANAVRHWDDQKNTQHVKVIHEYQVSSFLPQAEKEGVQQANCNPVQH
jgi:hypothetical protein